MKKIETLTDEQKAQFGKWVEKWVSIGTSIEPADFSTAEHAALNCYRIANRARPKVVLRMGSPYGATLGGALAAVILKAQVRSQVWSQVEAQVEAQVQTTWTQYRGCQLWAGWYAYISFFRDVCGWDNSALAAFQYDEQLALSCGWVWLHDNVCAISDRPRLLLRNKAGQLHCGTGPAMAYPDGWSIWAWNGVRVNEQIIMSPGTLTTEQIAKEQNAQVRQVMVERIGIERVCQMFNAQSVDKQGTYELLILDLGDGRKRPYLKMLNPSIGVWHVEGVRPDCDTVQKALNFRNGLTQAQVDDIDGANWYQQGDVIMRPQGSTRFKSQPVILT